MLEGQHKPNNVIFLHRRPKEGVQETMQPEGYTNQGRGVEREALLQARGEKIRELAASTGKLPHADRLVLAKNLGRLVHQAKRRRGRGWLTDLCVNSGISADRTLSTKHLGRYVLDPLKSGSDTENPKNLGAKLVDYIKVSDAYAVMEGLSENQVLAQEVCAGVGSLEEAYDPATDEQHDALVPLYRMLLAVGDDVAQKSEADAFLRGLYRWRWTSDAVDPSKPWWVDNHPMTSIEDGGFAEDRTHMLPKVELYSLVESEMVLVPHPIDAQEGDSELPPFTFRADLSLWLVLAPTGPSGRMRPYLTWMWKTRLTGEYRDGSDTHVIDVWAHPPSLGFRERDDGPGYIVGLVYGSGYPRFFQWHVKECFGTLGENLSAYVAAGRIPETFIDITPASLQQHLVKPGDAGNLAGDSLWGGANDRIAFGLIDYPTRAPLGTVASFIEVFMRNGGAEDFRDWLEEDLMTVYQRMQEETQRVEEMLSRNEAEVLAVLKSSDPRIKGGGSDHE